MKSLLRRATGCLREERKYTKGPTEDIEGIGPPPGERRPLLSARLGAAEEIIQLQPAVLRDAGLECLAGSSGHDTVRW